MANGFKYFAAVLVLPALILVLAAHAAYPADTSEGKGDTVADTGRERVIGCLLPLSGKYGIIGEKALRAINTAVGSLPEGAGYRVIVKDIGSGGKGLNAALKELLGMNGLAFIIGPLPSGLVQGAEDALSFRKVPAVVFPVSESESYGGPYVIKYFYSLEDQTEALSAYAARELGARNFAVLYPDTRTGKGLSELFSRAVTGAGGKVVYEHAYGPGEKDLSGETEWIASIRPHAIFIPDGAAVSAELVLRLKRSVKLRDVLFLGPSTWNSPVFLKLTAGEIDGFVYRAVFTDFFYYGDADWNGFNSLFEAKYGQKADSFEYQVYSAVRLVLSAAESGGPGGESIIGALERLGADPGYAVGRDGSGSLQVSPRPRILSVSKGELIDIMSVK